METHYRTTWATRMGWAFWVLLLAAAGWMLLASACTAEREAVAMFGNRPMEVTTR